MSRSTHTARSGSATSSQLALWPLATSSRPTSETSRPTSSEATGRFTSSPASASGPQLSGWLAGAMSGPSGPPRARASLSARQAVVAGYLTIATSGRRHTGSSPSCALSRCWASKLQDQTAGLGSTLWRMTWRHSATPAGRWHSQLVVSVRRISGNASGGERAAGWATPIAADARGSPGTKRHYELAQQVQLAGWATPATRDWRTPNHHPREERGGYGQGEQLNNQVAHLIPGASLNGSSAATGGRGLLNPEFSRWLLGIPAMWAACAPTETPLQFRRRRR